MDETVQMLRFVFSNISFLLALGWVVIISKIFSSVGLMQLVFSLVVLKINPPVLVYIGVRMPLGVERYGQAPKSPDSWGLSLEMPNRVYLAQWSPYLKLFAPDGAVRQNIYELSSEWRDCIQLIAERGNQYKCPY
ncbi:MAG: hypothetical protein ACFE8J_08735 [Candidatus Heimdallarchaeota archaeon]